jgi:beta-glucosidase
MRKSIILTAFLLVASSAMTQTYPFQDESLSFHERAINLVSLFTLEEKINQVGHQTSAISRLNIKGYNYWNEAIHGVARSGLATSFPVSKAMSSTWDLSLIFDCAVATSDEARAYNNTKDKGLTYWCPTINMSRDPRWGRDEENYGEDPFLTGKIAVEYIKGMQGNDPKYYKTIATAKHFVANNYEKGRHSTSSNMDARNLREYYLPAFEMAVKEGNVRSVMSAYNALNGIPCGANHELLIDILRNEWGFNGFVTSDCGAVDDVYQSNRHHYVNTAAEASAVSMVNGEDLNCGTTFQNYCKEAIEKGYMQEADLDSALVRVFEARFSVGEFDNASNVPWRNISEDVLDCEKHRQLTYKAAQEAIVLLKNNNNILPLDKTKSVAVIGPFGNTITLGGYSGSPTELTTPLDGIAEKMGYEISDGTVQFEDCEEQSVPSGSKRLTHEANGSAGNLGYIYNDDWVAFNNINFGNGKSRVEIYSGAQNTNATIVKFYLDVIDDTPEATVTCPVTGNWSKYEKTTVEVDPNIFKGIHKVYTQFEGGTNGDRYCANMDWFRFYDPNTTNPLEEDGPLYFYKGCAVTGTAETNLERAKEIAIKADIVVFAAGTDLSVSDESNDRTNLDLPGDQQKLLEAVYSVNPNVILLLQTCSSMTINWAKDNVPAIIEAWYGGQAQGKAIADVLYGDYNPSGKLTSTWYNSLSDLPTGMLNYDIRNAKYTYMYHDKTPLYPFGYGMSYTTYEYTELNISKSSLAAGEELIVGANITNTGKYAGAEIVQLYVRANSSIERPRKQLVGFARVELEPGETKTVSIPLKHKQLTYFNEQTNTFDVEEGVVDIYVAASFADVRLTGIINAEATTYQSALGIRNAGTNPKLQNDRIYNILGHCIGTVEDFDRLPKGFYIVGNKKVIKR